MHKSFSLGPHRRFPFNASRFWYCWCNYHHSQQFRIYSRYGKRQRLQKLLPRCDNRSSNYKYLHCYSSSYHSRANDLVSSKAIRKNLSMRDQANILRPYNIFGHFSCKSYLWNGVRLQVQIFNSKCTTPVWFFTRAYAKWPFDISITDRIDNILTPSELKRFKIKHQTVTPGVISELDWRVACKPRCYTHQSKQFIQ